MSRWRVCGEVPRTSKDTRNLNPVIAPDVVAEFNSLSSDIGGVEAIKGDITNHNRALSLPDGVKQRKYGVADRFSGTQLEGTQIHLFS